MCDGALHVLYRQAQVLFQVNEDQFLSVQCLDWSSAAKGLPMSDIIARSAAPPTLSSQLVAGAPIPPLITFCCILPQHGMQHAFGLTKTDASTHYAEDGPAAVAAGQTDSTHCVTAGSRFPP